MGLVITVCAAEPTVHAFFGCGPMLEFRSWVVNRLPMYWPRSKEIIYRHLVLTGPRMKKKHLKSPYVNNMNPRAIPIMQVLDYGMME